MRLQATGEWSGNRSRHARQSGIAGSCAGSASPPSSRASACANRGRSGACLSARESHSAARRSSPIERNASAAASRWIACDRHAAAAAQLLDRWRKAAPRPAARHRRCAARRPGAGRGAAPCPLPLRAEGWGVELERLSTPPCPSPRGEAQACNPNRCDSHRPRAPRRHARAHRGRSAPARRSPSAAS